MIFKNVTVCFSSVTIACFGAAIALILIMALPGEDTDFSNWDDRFEFTVGDEPARNRSWSGDIHELVILESALDQGTIKLLAEQKNHVRRELS